MPVKLVAMDLDGTLIGTDLQIPPRTREAIAAARARGVRFCVVTGRMYQSALPFVRELELNEMPVVAYNGALVKEYPSGRVISHDPLPLDACRRLAAFCEARGYHLQAYVNDNLYVPSMDRLTEEYLSIARVEAHPVGSLFLWIQEPSTKMLIVGDPNQLPLVRLEVQELLGSAASVVSSYPTFLEITNARVSKGLALESVARAMGLSRDDVLAIGDAMNDLPMLSWAGTSFAMAHAEEAVRRAANHITRTGPGDGVAEALIRMGLADE